MNRKTIKMVLLAAGFAILTLLIASLAIDFVLHALSKYEGVILRVLEIIFASSASLSLSIGFSLSINEKVNNITIGKEANTGAVNSINADGQTLTFNVYNSDPSIKNELVNLSKRVDEFEKNNIEEIVKIVVDRLEGKETHSVDNDFVTKFIHDAKTISNKDIQEIWAMLMVSSATSDSLVSKRTLDIVKNLSKKEADLFKRAAQVAFSDGSILKKHGDTLQFIDLSLLQDIGLIKNNNTLSSVITLGPNSTFAMREKNLVVIIKNLSSNTNDSLKYGCYALTKEGLELKRALELEVGETTIKDFVKELKKQNAKDVSISLHQISSIDKNGNISYNPTELSLD